MTNMEKKAFVYCSIFLIFWLSFIYFFSDMHKKVEGIIKEHHSLLENLRLSYDSFLRNVNRASELDEKEYDRLLSTSYTMIYKREYEQLREYLSITDQMELSDLIHTCVLINTYGTRDAEILRVSSDDFIPQKGFLISPALSTVVGKVQNSQGNIAEIIPVWNEQFHTQVTVRNEKNETNYPDLALIENKQVVNFNPAFPYNPGDSIYISQYEPGGYTLKRYEWTRIGQIASVKQNEIVEKYGIEFDYSREEILEERYFFIVE